MTILSARRRPLAKSDAARSSVIGVSEKNCISCGFGGENRITCVSTFEASRNVILGIVVDELIETCSFRRVLERMLGGVAVSYDKMPRTAIGRES